MKEFRAWVWLIFAVFWMALAVAWLVRGNETNSLVCVAISTVCATRPKESA